MSLGTALLRRRYPGKEVSLLRNSALVEPRPSKQYVTESSVWSRKGRMYPRASTEWSQKYRRWKVCGEGSILRRAVCGVGRILGRVICRVRRVGRVPGRAVCGCFQVTLVDQCVK